MVVITQNKINAVWPITGQISNHCIFKFPNKNVHSAIQKKHMLYICESQKNVMYIYTLFLIYEMLHMYK